MNSPVAPHHLKAIVNAFRNLGRNRVRTALSLLGIVIGVFSVTVIISLGIAVRSAIVGYVDGFVGRNFVSVNPAVPGASYENSMQALMMGTSPQSLTYDDVQALKNPREVRGAVAVNGTVSGQEYVKFGGEEKRAMIVGTSASYPVINPMVKIDSGRYFTEAEEFGMRPYVILGSKIAAKLFGGADPIGQKVKIKEVPVEVIGVLEPMGGMMGMDMDNLTVLPLRFMQKRFIGNDKIVEAHIRAVDEAHFAAMMDDIKRVLRERHNISDPSKDDFVLTSALDVTEKLNTITGVITWFLAFLAAISLLVGGIGIMNIMLVSVSERVREVGLRKALGAKRHDIMILFLSEAVALTTAGGAIGGGLGFLLTVIVIAVMRWYGLDVPYLVSVGAFLGAALVAAAVGLIFGLYPARKAAKLDAIIALRFE
jgi:putative ABC transport system permease protein